MANLKPSERRLLIAFSVLIVGLGSLIGYRMLREKKDVADLESSQLQTDIGLYQNLLGERDLWEKRRMWLQRRLPAFTTQEAEAPKLEAIVSDSARRTGVAIDTPRPIALQELGDGLVQIGLALGVSGSNDEVIRFLALLQTRDGFRLMQTLNLKPDKKDPEIVRCELTLNQLYIVSDLPVPPAEPVPTEAPEPEAAITASSSTAAPSPPVN